MGNSPGRIAAGFSILREARHWSVRAGLDVLVAKTVCAIEEVAEGKEKLKRIVSMIAGLIKANSSYRLHEESDGKD